MLEPLDRRDEFTQVYVEELPLHSSSTFIAVAPSIFQGVISIGVPPRLLLKQHHYPDGQ